MKETIVDSGEMLGAEGAEWGDSAPTMTYFNGVDWVAFDEAAGQFPPKGWAAVSLQRLNTLQKQLRRRKSTSAEELADVQWRRDHCLRVCLAIGVASRSIRVALGNITNDEFLAARAQVEGDELDKLRALAAESDAPSSASQASA